MFLIKRKQNEVLTSGTKCLVCWCSSCQPFLRDVNDFSHLGVWAVEWTRIKAFGEWLRTKWVRDYDSRILYAVDSWPLQFNFPYNTRSWVQIFLFRFWLKCIFFSRHPNSLSWWWAKERCQENKRYVALLKILPRKIFRYPFSGKKNQFFFSKVFWLYNTQVLFS